MNVLPEVEEGFNVKLYSLSLIVHWYWVSYIVRDDENEQVTFELVINPFIIIASPTP